MISAAKQKISDHFDAYAPTWHHRLEQHPYAARYEAVRRMVSGLTCDTVLDIGCGTGDYCCLFDPAATDYIGYDLSPKMIEQCRALYPGYRFEVGDGDVIPAPDASSDLTLDIAVIEYYDDALPHMRELARVTKPGGSIVVAVPNGNNRTRTLLQRFARFVDGLKGRAIQTSGKPSIWHNSKSLSDMERLGRDAGMTLVDHSYCSVRITPYDRQNEWISRRIGDRRAWEWISRWSATILICRYTRSS